MAYEEIVTSSRKINDKALDTDITLTASDVGALPTSGGTIQAGKGINFGENYLVYNNAKSGSFEIVSNGGGRIVIVAGSDSPEDGGVAIGTQGSNNIVLQPKSTSITLVKDPTDLTDAANKAYVDAVKRPYLVTFTNNTATEYTADKTLQEIYDAVQAGYYVYGYVDVPYTDAYIPLSSCFTSGSETTSIYLHFEGPMASANGSMVASNQSAAFISLAATNNADATSKTYKYTVYRLVSTGVKINQKQLNGNIALTAADVNAVGLAGDQTVAGKKTFTDEATFNGPAIFADTTTQVTFDGGISARSATFYSNIDFSNAAVSGLSGLLPTVTTSNNGQFLRVVNGAWAAATVENANGVSF